MMDKSNNTYNLRKRTFTLPRGLSSEAEEEVDEKPAKIEFTDVDASKIYPESYDRSNVRVSCEKLISSNLGPNFINKMDFRRKLVIAETDSEEECTKPENFISKNKLALMKLGVNKNKRKTSVEETKKRKEKSNETAFKEMREKRKSVFLSESEKRKTEVLAKNKIESLEEVEKEKEKGNLRLVEKNKNKETAFKEKGNLRKSILMAEKPEKRQTQEVLVKISIKETIIPLDKEKMNAVGNEKSESDKDPFLMLQHENKLQRTQSTKGKLSETKSKLPLEKRMAKRTGFPQIMMPIPRNMIPEEECMDELQMIKKELNDEDAATIIEVKKQYRLLGTINLIDEEDNEKRAQEKSNDDENNRDQNNTVVQNDEADSGRESCPLENNEANQSQSKDKNDMPLSPPEEPVQSTEGAQMVEQTVETEVVTDNMEYAILNMTPEEYEVNRFYYGDEYIHELALGQISAEQPPVIIQQVPAEKPPGIIIIDDLDDDPDSKSHLNSSLLLSPDEEMQVGKIARMPQIKEFVQVLAQRNAVLDHHAKQIEKLKILGCVKHDDYETIEKRREDYHKNLIKCVAEFYFMMRDLSCIGKERVYREIYERLEIMCKKVDIPVKRNEMFVERIIDEYSEMNKGNEFKKLLESEKITIQNDTPSSSTPLCSPVSTTTTPSTSNDEYSALKEKFQIRLIIEHKNGEDGHMNLPSLERMLADKISDIITNKAIEPALNSPQNRSADNLVQQPSPSLQNYENLYQIQGNSMASESEEASKASRKVPIKRQYRSRDQSAKKQVMENWSASNKTNPKSIIRNILTEKSKSHSLADIAHPQHSNHRLSVDSSSIAPPLRPSLLVSRTNQLQMQMHSPHPSNSPTSSRSSGQMLNTLLSLRQFRPPLMTLASPQSSPTSSSSHPTTPIPGVHDNNTNKPSTPFSFSSHSFMQTNTNLHNISTYSQAASSHNNVQPMVSSTTAIPTPSVYQKPSNNPVSCNKISSDSQGYLASLPPFVRSSTPVCLFCRKNRAEFKCSGNCNIVCCGQKECLQFGQDPKFHQNHS